LASQKLLLINVNQMMISAGNWQKIVWQIHYLEYFFDSGPSPIVYTGSLEGLLVPNRSKELSAPAAELKSQRKVGMKLISTA
jgi:hypothetical protein